jgi:hypothetical protein
MEFSAIVVDIFSDMDAQAARLNAQASAAPVRTARAENRHEAA